MKAFSGFHDCEGLSVKDYHLIRHSHAVPQNHLILGKSTCFFHASGIPHVKPWSSSCVVLWCEGTLKLYADSPRLLKELQFSGKWSGHQNMLCFSLKAENTYKMFVCSDVSGLGQLGTSCSMEQVVSIMSRFCAESNKVNDHPIWPALLFTANAIEPCLVFPDCWRLLRTQLQLWINGMWWVHLSMWVYGVMGNLVDFRKAEQTTDESSSHQK